MKFDIHQERLLAHLENIVGDRNPFTCRDALDAVAAYIESNFRSVGLGVETDSFEMFSQTHHNLVARFPSLNPSAPALLIGAHYDSVPDSPGADDNASGVA